MIKKLFLFVCSFLICLLATWPLAQIQASTNFEMSPKALMAGQQSAKYVPEEIIVKINQGTRLNYQNPKTTGIASLDALNQKNQAFKIEPIFKGHSNDELSSYYKIKYPKDKDLNQIRQELLKSKSVEKAGLNYLAKATWTPDDTYYPSQWALNKINASAAWDVTQGSSETVIAVIDSGVDTDHPDLSSKIWVNTADPVNGLDDDANGYTDDNIGWDWVANTGYGEYGSPCIDRDPADPNRTADNDPNPEPTGIDEDECLYPGVDSGQHHGTSVAGIAAAITNNAQGVAGVCPECTIMALRVLDDEGWGSYDQIAEAIVYAGDKGADIINLSLAGPYDDTIINVAVHYAFTQDSVLAAAAANGGVDGIGDDIDLESEKLSPVCNDNYDYLDGGENEVIGVAATDSSDVKMSWSNYGKKYVDISAPGTGLHAPLNGGTYTTSFGGTSGATPIVSGVLGLVKSQHPTWDNKLIRDTAIDLIQNINSLNPSYSGKLGGRVKTDRAVDPTERLQESGMVIKGSGPEIYLLQNGQKRHILSPEIFSSYYRSWSYYVNISDSRLNDYPNGPDLIFRQGTLIKAIDYPQVYQVEYPSGEKRHITSPEIFLGLGYDWNDIISTSTSLVNLHPTGEDINSTGNHAAGALIKTSTAPEIYVLDIEGGLKVKRHIVNLPVFKYYFRSQDVAIINDTEMESYPNGSAYHFQDGALLKGTGPEIYLISYGKKRHITSPDAYLARGFRWGQAIIVSDEELAYYETGETLN